MQNIILALRNIARNRRRSIVTVLAVAFSCGGLALFGGYVSWAFRAVEEQTVGVYGHIEIYRKGYYANGSGDPASYALGNYDQLKSMVQSDPVIRPRLEMVTGQLLFTGVVTCASTHTASTFFGMGVFPSEDEHLWRWNPYELSNPINLRINAPFFAGPPELDDNDVEGGSLGSGLGRILHLDRPFDKKTARSTSDKLSSESAPNLGTDADLNFLTEQANAATSADENRASVELIIQPPEGGLPNIITLGVRKLMPRATKELEDQLIKLHVRHASELLFPGQPLHVTAVILLLKRTSDTPAVAQRLQQLFAERNLDLELKTWNEIRPFYNQVHRMLGIIFVFMFCLLVTLMAFTIYNTQSAGIIERLRELGTLRALGVNRLRLWKTLEWEGLLLGLIGGGLGVLLAIGGDLLLQGVDVIYVPPGVSFHAKVEVLALRNPKVLVLAFAGSLICALLSAAFPARRAARTPIVQALRQT